MLFAIVITNASRMLIAPHPVQAPGANSTLLVVIFGIEEAVKEAQNGGSGVVIYFRKEGRALGEVTKVRVMLPQLRVTR